MTTHRPLGDEDLVHGSHQDTTPEQRLLEFLIWISSDELIAANRYLQLHRKLTTFFQNNQAGADAERLADKTLDGVAAYVADGTSVDRERLEVFVLQRARWVRNDYLKERHRRCEMPPQVPAIDLLPRESGSLQKRLEDCLQQLNAEDLDLVLQFYSSDGRNRIAQRKTLARRYGMTEATLRVRLYRIRAKLRNWLDQH